MHSSGKGALLDRRFGLQDPPTLVSTLSSGRPITFSHLRVDFAGLVLGSIPAEAAYSIHLHLRETAFLLRAEGDSTRRGYTQAGGLCFFDLQSPPDIAFDTPFRTIRSYVPLSALQAFSEEAGRRGPVFLRPPSNEADDPFIRHLFGSLQPILGDSEKANPLLVDHIALALQAHLLHTYTTTFAEGLSVRGGLAPWQERRAKEAMTAKLDKDVSLAELARECGLSSAHFARAFKQATGRPPYRWLLERRIETAQGLLLNSQMSLQQIAITCGFSDQSGFTRAFTRLVGTSPAAWRRLRQG